MEKNIPALLDTKARTVHVMYQHTSSESNNYTYVSNLDNLKVGDFVVVPTSVRTKISENERQITWDTNRYATPQLMKDAAAMLNNQRLSIAKVVEIDELVDIEPNDDTEYKWVICRIDLEDYAALLVRNKQITDAVQEAYKQTLRRTFAERILGELPDSTRTALTQLLG